MGFEMPERTARITFDGTEYEGAEVVCRLNLSVKEFMEYEALQDDIPALLTAFGENIILEWNLEKDGQPVPVGGEALQEQPLEFGNLLTANWRIAVVGPPVPLEQPSENGGLPEGMTVDDLSLADFSRPA